jgi:hypothetical protein
MCFVWISEQTVIISPYSINWFVFIIEAVGVYCAVRTGFRLILVTEVPLMTGIPCAIVAVCGDCADETDSDR